MRNRFFTPLLQLVILALFFSACAPEEAPINTVQDVDGNVYHTITIGTQTWMVENLKTTKFRDGTPIPNVTDNAQWGNLTTGAYCDYNNTDSTTATYGRLYNWYAVSDSRNIAPAGWRVATDADWTKLTSYLGGVSRASAKLKEAGLTHWASPNSLASNQSGFTALPGGTRNSAGTFVDIGFYGYWWCSNEYSATSAQLRIMYHFYSDVVRSVDSKVYGFSVRCLKN